MHIHLDPVGGIAGDMFVAAVLNAWPELGSELPALLTAAGLPDSVTVQCVLHRDHGLQGTRYCVSDTGTKAHPHSSFREIAETLSASTLPAGAREQAIAIFTLLAEAEAKVHGLRVEDVVFHEVGAWDSIADIVASAFLIDALQAASWSISALPLGSGLVRAGHGLLPVPAPATALLLSGFVVYDDGRDGERVTPTGAAILKYLKPAYRLPAYPMVIGRTGIGFGTRQLDGLPNILRLMALQAQHVQQQHDVAVLHFEIDDQPAEDLAVGLERLRSLPGVIDVLQIPVLAKQGRLAAQIQVLAQPQALNTVVDQCFSETATLGLRWQIVHRCVLKRDTVEYQDGERRIQVKVAQRPNGSITGKAELRDVAGLSGFAERQRLRQKAEKSVLDKAEDDDE